MRRLLSITSLTALTLTFVLLCSAPLLADHKPGHNPGNGGGDGGGGGNNGGGVIYFSWNGDVHSMNDDGTDITTLTNFPFGYGPWGDPSHELHAGKRWFLQDAGTSVIALSETGDVVPIDLGTGIEVVAQPRWGNGDSIISFEGRWRDNGDVLIGGLFEVEYSVDADGNLTGSTGPATLLFETSLFDDGYGLRPDMASHCWAPDGRFFVYGESSTDKRLLIGDIATGDSVTLFYDPDATTAHSPRCSPAGDKVMFQYKPDIGHTRVMLINSDGTGLKLLARGSVSWSKSVGVWSPTGSHLLYQHWDHFWEDSYFLRASSSGSGKTRLTDQSMGAGYQSPRALGWRF